MKPRALDLFCGAGGASMGLHRAGFDVTGIDIKPQKRYPFRFIQGDALRPPVRLGDFDLIWASPPCQGYSRAKNNGSGKSAPKLICEVREMLKASGAEWILENVPGAPMPDSIMLCGASFGLGVSGMDLARHRLFETSFYLMAPKCQHRRGNTVGVYGNGTNRWHRDKLGRNVSVDEQREAMGMPWAVRSGLSQAIPPAYAEHIGRYALMALGLEP